MQVIVPFRHPQPGWRPTGQRPAPRQPDLTLRKARQFGTVENAFETRHGQHDGIHAGIPHLRQVAQTEQLLGGPGAHRTMSGVIVE